MDSELKSRLFVVGVMFGIPWVLWTLQNWWRAGQGLPPAPVGELDSNALSPPGDHLW